MSTLYVISVILLLIVGANSQLFEDEDYIELAPRRRGNQRLDDSRGYRSPFPIRRLPNGLPVLNGGQRPALHEDFVEMPRRLRTKKRSQGYDERPRNDFQQDSDNENFGEQRFHRRRDERKKGIKRFSSNDELNMALEGYTYEPPSADLNEEYGLSFTTSAPVTTGTLPVEKAGAHESELENRPEQTKHESHQKKEKPIRKRNHQRMDYPDHNPAFGGRDFMDYFMDRHQRNSRQRPPFPPPRGHDFDGYDIYPDFEPGFGEFEDRMMKQLFEKAMRQHNNRRRGPPLPPPPPLQ